MKMKKLLLGFAIGMTLFLLWGEGTAYAVVTGECVNGDTRCSPDARTLFNCVDTQWQPSICSEETLCAFVGGIHQCVVVDEVPDSAFCESCDAFSLSYVLTSIFGENSEIDFVNERQCTPKPISLIPPSPGQGPKVCIFQLIKLALVPISLIFITLLTNQFFQQRFKDLKKKKGLRILLSIVIGVIVSWMFFVWPFCYP